MIPNLTELKKEFDRQVKNLIEKRYPEAIGISEDEFLKHIAPLKEKLSEAKTTNLNINEGKLPFVIAITNGLIDSEKAMSLVEWNGKNGVTILRPHTTKSFNPIESLNLPSSRVYLLIDIDRGKDNINLPPNEAMKLIIEAKRSPLTIDEGIAIVTHYPEFLIKNNCFSCLGSRTGSDQRVPAIWINGNKQPNLGWCWDGNPHTWLGSASCAERIS